MRYDTINKVIRDIDAFRYLEIGFQQGINFEQIKCMIKVAVDPNPVVKHDLCIITDSDTFFSQNEDNFDVIFIDGLHTYEQVKKDFESSIKILNQGGAICLHDTSPKNEEYARSFAEGGRWNGDCYKLVINLYASLYKFKYYTVDDDHGVTVVFPDQVEEREAKAASYSYEWFDRNRARVLNIKG